MRPPRGWAPEAEWGRAPCDRRGAGPQKPSGAGPRATAVGLGPRSRVGQGPVRPPRGWAPEAVPSAVQWSSEADRAVTTPMTAPLPGDPNFLPRRVCRIFQVGRVQPNPTQPPPPADPPAHERHRPAPRRSAPTGRADQGDRERPPHPHARAHSTGIADPNSPPSGRAVGGGGAPDPGRPSQQWKAPPPGTPFRHPHNPKPSRGELGPDRPPPSTPDGARDRGRTRGGARTTWNGPNSAQCRDRARCARHTTQEGGGRTPRERERTHTQRARGDYQKGNRTEHAESTDRVERRTSERG